MSGQTRAKGAARAKGSASERPFGAAGVGAPVSLAQPFDPDPSRAARAFSAASEAFAVGAVPCVLAGCAAAGIDQTALLSMACAAAACLFFFAGYEKSRPRLRDTMPLAVLAALAAAGRILFAPFPNFKPVSAIAVIAGVVFGRRGGFMVGALAALASNFFFGQGPWTPWQMYAWGMVGWGAGLLGSTRFAQSTLAACAYGFAASMGYGLILNMWTILGFLHLGISTSALAVYAASLPFDLSHAFSTVVFLLVLYAPWRRKLARVKRRYALTG